MSEERLHTYARLEQVCERMLDAAQGGDWNLVASIEGDSRALIERLRANREPERLDHEMRREKFRILRSILAIEAQIRHLANPWQRHVDNILSSGAARRH